MHSSLVITTPAEDLALLSIEEMREAAGVTGGASDAALTAMETRLSAAVMTECKIAVGAGAPPTLLQETCTETFRQVCAATIVLSRRHEIEITSIVEDDETLESTEYLVDPESGLLARLRDDSPVGWNARKIVVVYEAGFEEVPGDLKMTMLDFFRLAWLEKDRDPSVKVVETDIPDVERVRTDYWAGSIPGQSGEGAVPDVVAGQLARFRNIWL